MPDPTPQPLVIDASALAECLITSTAGCKAAVILHEHAHNLHVPHLAIVETTSVIRGLVLGGHLAAARAKRALADLGDLRATRWPTDPLLGRIWQLRADLSATTQPMSRSPRPSPRAS